MTVTIPRHPERVEAFLQKSDEYLAVLATIALKNLNLDGRLHGMDLLAVAVCKRTHSASSGLKWLVRSWNLLASAAMLKTHFDTTLRYYTAWLVDDPNKFATEFLAGKQINRMNGQRDKRLLSDSYSRDRLTEKYPWITEVYIQTSGFVHFSDTHVAACFTEEKENGEFSLRVSAFDFDFPEERWAELVECYLKITTIFLSLLKWVRSDKAYDPCRTSRRSRWQMAALRRQPKNTVMVLSDQDSQFSSYDWRGFLGEHYLQ